MQGGERKGAGRKKNEFKIIARNLKIVERLLDNANPMPEIEDFTSEEMARIAAWRRKEEAKLQSYARLEDETNAQAIKRARKAQRENVLDRWAPKRRCPLCGKFKFKAKQWVILSTFRGCARPAIKSLQRRGVNALCKSCYWSWVIKGSKDDE